MTTGDPAAAPHARAGARDETKTTAAETARRTTESTAHGARAGVGSARAPTDGDRSADAEGRSPGLAPHAHESRSDHAVPGRLGHDGTPAPAGGGSTAAAEDADPPRHPDSPGARPGELRAVRTRPVAGLRLVPGLVVVALAVGLAASLHALLPSLGLVTAALILGVLAGNLPVLPATASVGVSWATRRLLRTGVVLLGLGLSVPQLLGVGPGVLLAVLLTVAGTFLITIRLGRLLGLSRGLSLCVGTGFAVCGASAVAAVESVIRREERDVVTAIALVTLYGSLSVAALPLLGGAIGLDEGQLGRWIGLSVHEVAQVVAAASPVGEGAVTEAVVVKLSRVVLLAPMIAAIGLAERRHRLTRDARGTRPPMIPLFVSGFLVAVAVRSSGLLPDVVLDHAATLTTVLLAAALFGLGTTVRVAALLRTGPRALLLGLGSTIAVTTLAWVTLWALG